MFQRFDREANFARRAVIEAFSLCEDVQAEMVIPELEKEDRSPVTVADFASQALVAGRLHEAFPQDPLVAEEDSSALRSPSGKEALASVRRFVGERRERVTEEQVARWIDLGNGSPAPRFWTLDPIDGTAGFLRGDQWVVALALIEEGQVVLGALGLPRLDTNLQTPGNGMGSVIVAVRGEGAWIGDPDWREPRRLGVSARSEGSEARMMGSVEPRHTDMAMLDRLRDRLGTGESLVKMDSQAKFAVVAGGKAELIFRLLSPDRPNYQEKIWDQAAGSLIVEEAGGQVSDLRGRPLDFSTGHLLSRNRGVLVSNGRLHEAALTALKEERAVPDAAS